MLLTNQYRDIFNRNYNILGYTNSYNTLYNNGFANRPIGLVSKSYGYMYDNISRNIGNNNHDYDGYGMNIGSLASVSENSSYQSWFMNDEKKVSTSNYLDYVDDFYFTNKGGLIKVFNNQKEFMDSFGTLLPLENNKVNAVRGYLSEGDTNPNSFDGTDTRLGEVNKIYLDHTLDNTISYIKSLNSYSEPSLDNTKETNNLDTPSNKFGITKGAYHNFGFEGHFGLGDTTEMLGGMVKPNRYYTGDIIYWSTADHTYDSSSYPGTSRDLDLVRKIVGEKNVYAPLSVEFKDLPQHTTQQSGGHLYYPFGNFYSITYSLGMYSASNDITKKFIEKSMYGYDLLDDTFDSMIDFNYHSGDETEVSQKRHSRVTGKKYYAGLGTRGTNYLDMITKTNVAFTKDTTDNTGVIRIQPIDAGNDNLWTTNTYYVYAEAEGNVRAQTDAELATPLTDGLLQQTYNGGTHFGRYISYDPNSPLNKEDIISYTNKRFLYGKYGTLIGRFHGPEFESATEARANRDFIETAISKYGVSHGRNLLKRKHEGAMTNGYSNPYCRVWTFHHQYKTLRDTIRPFDNTSLMGTDIEKGRPNQLSLEKHTVLGKNGLVKIAPTYASEVKNLMFSIENLAWKHEQIEDSQRGEHGGRIMWFPPYDLKFSENVQVNWNSTAFIGRGEQIHTYTNTERSGQLSFTLLIDHPNVINKWRKEINPASIGIGDVDDVESAEQTLLRFFAGCDILSGSPSDANKDKKNKPSKDKPYKEGTKKTSQKTPADAKIIFYVFFPNNYSGADDSSSGNGGVKPAWYLINGFGSQKGYVDGLTANSRLVDIQVDETSRGKFNIGYEMKPSRPISSTETDEKYTDKVYSDYNNTLNNYILGEDTTNHIYYATQKASPRKGTKSTVNYWAYRCDSKGAYNYTLQAINNCPTMYYSGGKTGTDDLANYADLRSYGLNTMVYRPTSNASSPNYVSLFETNGYLDINENELDSMYSFADVFATFENTSIIDELTNEDMKAELKNIIENFKILSIDVKGAASKDGYTKNNYDLSLNRAKTVWAWMKNSKYGKYFKNAEKSTVWASDSSDTSITAQGEIGANAKKDANSFEMKIARHVRVEIRYSKTEIVEPEAISNINVADNQTQMKIDNVRKTVRELRDASVEEILKYIKEVEETGSRVEGMVAEGEGEYAIRHREEKTFEYLSAKNNKAMSGTVNNYDGYGQEYKYFDTLSKDAPFLHDKIVDKIKFFDPAFHSVSPEGFNARLTFLHQCTRQGPTMGANSNMHQASNLAFGAPPVCILRIGDFYNTRIVIENISIDYDNASWDLNDEGIGVMPMLAHVSLGFKFIGGSDLSEPIKSLQNAVSFNYYANTSVYDNRASVGEIRDNMDGLGEEK